MFLMFTDPEFSDRVGRYAKCCCFFLPVREMHLYFKAIKGKKISKTTNWR